jgi:hypothetical protein
MMENLAWIVFCPCVWPALRRLERSHRSSVNRPGKDFPVRSSRSLWRASYLTVEKFKTRRPFKNGEMQGSEKIQGAQCIQTDKRSGFFR